MRCATMAVEMTEYEIWRTTNCGAREQMIGHDEVHAK